MITSDYHKTLEKNKFTFIKKISDTLQGKILLYENNGKKYIAKLANKNIVEKKVAIIKEKDNIIKVPIRENFGKEVAIMFYLKQKQHRKGIHSYI